MNITLRIAHGRRWLTLIYDTVKLSDSFLISHVFQENPQEGLYTSCWLILLAPSRCGSLWYLHRTNATRCLLRYAPRWLYLWSWLHRVIKESLSFLKCFFILLQVEWCWFISSFAHPLQSCVIFTILWCPTSGSTAASHNIDSWFYFFLLNSNKLDVLVFWMLGWS